MTPSANPNAGDVYIDQNTLEMNIYDGSSWRVLHAAKPAAEPLPEQRHQGDLMWVSDMLMDDREIIMQAGAEVGVRLLWVDEVAEQSDLERDPDAKHYGSLWSYDRDLGKFWKRYWEMKEAR